LTYNKAALETIKKIYIYSNGCHLEWMVRLSDIILKGAHKDHPPKKNWFKLVQQFQRRIFKYDLFFKICIVCIICINHLKETFSCKRLTTHCHVAAV
jgi:hypothetical protein